MKLPECGDIGYVAKPPERLTSTEIRRRAREYRLLGATAATRVRAALNEVACRLERLAEEKDASESERQSMVTIGAFALPIRHQLPAVQW
jgi:hypothetical protein